MKVSEKSMVKSAEIFCSMLPLDAYVVPMPSHLGYPTYMLHIAAYILKYRPDIKLLDILECEPHESLCDMKRSGKPIEQEIVFKVRKPLLDCNVCVIDNVYDTGKTWDAASHFLRSSGYIPELYVIAKTETNQLF